MATARATLGCSSGEAVGLCGRGSGTCHWPRPVCLFLGRLREKLPYYLEKSDHGKRRQLGSYRPFKPRPILKHNRLQKVDIRSSLRCGKMHYEMLVAPFILQCL